MMVRPAFSPGVEEKVGLLTACLRSHAPLVIAYSGGVDSAYLLAAATQLLGEKVIGVIADSPSLPREALREAVDLGRRIGARVEIVRTSELEDPRYNSNPVNRCYYCKAELFSRLEELARAEGYTAIAYGENADDAGHVRPGVRAAMEFHVLAPLKEAGLTKQEIRELSQALGLPTADAPAQPCLSSRIPHGTPVTAGALAMIEKAEAFVRRLGFRVFRVRHIVEDEMAGRYRARLQVSPDEMGRLAPLVPRVEEGLAAAGYRSVEIDPAGYRSPG